MKKSEKTALTPDEVLRVAYASIIRRIDQDDLAALLDVNSGRVAEAIIAIRWAINNHKAIYRHSRRRKVEAKLAVEEDEKPPLIKYIEEHTP
jgi:hypothetical protein